MHYQQQIKPLQTIARAAGEKILDIYATFTQGDQITKDDDSPLTQADLASQQHIVSELTSLTPEIPIMAEEGDQQSYTHRQQRDQFRCVDPLDGTKEFIKKNDEFTINIALIKHGSPVLGLIYLPVYQVGYYAWQDGSAWRYDETSEEQIDITQPDPGCIDVVCSRSHLNEPTRQFLEQLEQQYDQVATLQAGSSLKFCRVAEGKAHLYPRFAPTKEWDTAAGQIIVTEAGGKVLQLPGHTPLQYNKQSILNPSFYVTVIDLDKQLFVDK